MSEESEQGVPDLGFFTSPGGTPAGGGSQFGGSQFGGSQVTGGQFGGGQFGGGQIGGTQFGGTQFGGSQFTGEQFGGAPVGHQFGGGPTPPLAPTQPPRTSGLPGWAIALIAGASALVLVGIMAAVAIPTFLHHRSSAVAARTTVALPPELDGMQRVLDLPPDARAAADQGLTSMPPYLSSADFALYVDDSGSRTLVVLAAKSDGRVMCCDGVTGAFDGVRASLPPTAESSGVVEHDAGRLGGTMHCMTSTFDGVTMQSCLAQDPGSFVLTAYTVGEGIPVGDVAFATRVRETVVSRS